jgi:cytochrome c556
MLLAAAAASFALGGLVTQALAQPAPPPASPAQTVMRQLNGAGRDIRTELAKETPDTTAIKAAVTRLNTAAGKLPDVFDKPVDPASGVKSAAKPEVWSDAKGFAEAAAGLQAQTARFLQLADGGDVEAMKAQVAAVNGACGTCHHAYRVAQQK